MTDFDKIVELVDNDTVKLADSFKDLLHTELMLGQSRHVCRYGTLSDGHERITDAQRYYAAIKEMWNRATSIEDCKVSAMRAQADLIDAQEALGQAKTTSSKLRAQADVLSAQSRLKHALIGAEDTLRQLDEFNRVRLELMPIVKAKYPEGIEQAEPDNWEAVARYRVGIEQITHTPQMLRHIPLEQIHKAKLAIELGNGELGAWLVADKGKEIKELAGNNPVKYIEMQESN